ncbi:hypothetical protein EJ08DRAFT_594379, partial [Tothia fuscella]
KEGGILLILNTYNSSYKSSLYNTALFYSTASRTLNDRAYRRIVRVDSRVNNYKLSTIEEKVLL